MNSQSSNWTGRFPRTSRDAFGYQVKFRTDPDRLVGHVLAALAIFVAGLMLGGAL